jgi:hypothetical protein
MMRIRPSCGSFETMGMFDDLMGNMGGLEAIAAKLGLEPAQMQALMSEISAKIGAGETSCRSC